MTDTLLSYAIVHDPDPLVAGAAASFTLVVSNPGRRYVACTSITLSLPVGTNAKDLTADAGSIQLGQYDGWTATPSGNSINLIPAGGSAQIGPDGVAFTFANVQVNDQPGTAVLSIAETASAEGGASQLRSLQLPVAKFPGSFHLSGLLVIPSAVVAPSSALLMWTGYDGPGCTYQLDYQPGDDAGSAVSCAVGAVGPRQSAPLTRRGGVTFTLTATIQVAGQDAPVTVQRQATVTVATMSIDVQATPPAVPVNGLVRLVWHAPNAVQCMLEDGTRVPAAGERYYLVRRNCTFVVSAFDAEGNMVSASAYVNIDPAIAATEAGQSYIGAAGTNGQDAYWNDAMGEDSDQNGGNGAPGAAIAKSLTLAPPDLVGRSRVVPVIVTGGAGGRGGNGGWNCNASFDQAFGSGGDGANGGNANLALTLDPAAGPAAQYIVDVRGGAAGTAGVPEPSAASQGLQQPPGPGKPGIAGSATITLNGQPLTIIE